MMQKKAFTLVELLVVISIIAMLLAVLMPALSKARDIGNKTVCLTNLKAIGLASSVYSNENSDYLPAIYRGLDPEVQAKVPAYSTLSWAFDLARYVGAKGVNFNTEPEMVIRTVFYCKCHPRTYRNAVGNVYSRVSYGPNIKVLRDNFKNWSNEVAYRFYKRTAIKDPGSKMYAADKFFSKNATYSYDYAWVNYDLVPGRSFKIQIGTDYETVARCHTKSTKGTNMIMFDGHAINVADPYKISLWGWYPQNRAE